MKCPKCGNDHKRSLGMTCGTCRYAFALDPKEDPHISDAAFNKTLDRLSNFGRSYFTYNQLYAQLHKLALKKKRVQKYILVPLAGIMTFIALSIFGQDIGFLFKFVILIIVIVGVGAVTWTWRPGIKASCLRNVIEKYERIHGIDNLVKGNYFKDMEPKRFDKEILKYAPERMLIVERDDIADMLLMNNFAADNKTLVVSAQGYPKRAFLAFKHFAKKNPDLPVYVMHDASKAGVQLKTRLQMDPAWGLQNRDIQDLGLFPDDVKRLEQPIWLPDKSKERSKETAYPKSSDPVKNVGQGFRVPLDVAPPLSFMSASTMAMVAGVALLSPELLAQRAADASSGSFGGGFG